MAGDVCLTRLLQEVKGFTERLERSVLPDEKCRKRFRDMLPDTKLKDKLYENWPEETFQKTSYQLLDLAERERTAEMMRIFADQQNYMSWDETGESYLDDEKMQRAVCSSCDRCWRRAFLGHRYPGFSTHSAEECDDHDHGHMY
jgi:hypothetical protein